MPLFSSWFTAFAASLVLAKRAVFPWEERFAQPPAEARILKIIHNWPDKSDAQDLMISTVATQGFGGVVYGPSSDQYLQSEAKWVAFTRAVKAAKQAGLALWLYDELGAILPAMRAALRCAVIRSGKRAACWLPLRNRRVVALRWTFPRANWCSRGRIPFMPALSSWWRRWTSIRISTTPADLEAPAGRWQVLVVTEDRLDEGTHAEWNLHAKIFTSSR